MQPFRDPITERSRPSDPPAFRNFISSMIDKSYLSEYISSNSSLNKEPCVKEELSDISPEDEACVVKYLLDIMRAHDIITEEEYQAVLYQYD